MKTFNSSVQQAGKFGLWPVDCSAGQPRFVDRTATDNARGRMRLRTAILRKGEVLAKEKQLFAMEIDPQRNDLRNPIHFGYQVLPWDGLKD